MIKISIAMMSILFLYLLQSDSFKESQLHYPRVRQAYEDKESNILALLKRKQIQKNELKIYLRAFKREKQIELWGKDNSNTKILLD